MDWLFPIFYIFVAAEAASLLEDIEDFFTGSKQCKVKPYDYSTYNTSCGVRPAKCSDSYYRPIDGACNNLNFGWWATPYTPYIRLINNSYSDGIHKFPKSKNGKDLPNPRECSLNLYSKNDIDDIVWTLGFMQYCQIIAHDMALTAGVGQTGIFVACCDKGQLTKEAKTDPRCAPIILPKNDPYNGPAGRICMNFYRTETSKDRKNCKSTTKVAEPLTNVTGYMDISFLYGSDLKTAEAVREKKGGRLKSVKKEGTQFLPQVQNPTQQCSVAKSTDACYKAGDIRVNQNPQLAVLHIVYMLHHNNIADKLSKLNPHWDDEKTFQETRNIVIAVHQYVFYYELLFYILGGATATSKGIVYPGSKDFINDYDPLINAGVSNEFSTAAYRLFHTLIKGPLKVYNVSREVDSTIKLQDWMLQPGIIEKGDNYRGLIRGLGTEPMDGLDAYFTNDILNYLFKDGVLGEDLKTIDIVRGRDHGLGPYVDAIEICCLGKKPKTFKDLEQYIDKKYVDILKKLYNSPEDVDLTVGISVEKRLTGTVCGPVSCCLIAEQFYRTRRGDRYFFENNQHKSAFTLKQLNAIRETSSFAMLLCQVAGVKKMQPKAFFQISLINPLVSCSSIPQLDLSLWKDKKS